MESLLMQEQKSFGQTLVHKKTFRYAGICNLCYFENHLTEECPFALTFYHATQKKALLSILEHGLHPHRGRLGHGVYASDNHEMCIKYVSKKKDKFNEPVLLKLKVMISGEIKKIDYPFDCRNISENEIKKENIQAIECPYFSYQKEDFHEFRLIDPELIVVVSWRPIYEEELLKYPRLWIIKHEKRTKQKRKAIKGLQKKNRNRFKLALKGQESDENSDEKDRQEKKSSKISLIRKMMAIKNKQGKKKNRFSRQLRRLQ